MTGYTFTCPMCHVRVFVTTDLALGGFLQVAENVEEAVELGSTSPRKIQDGANELAKDFHAEQKPAGGS